MSQESLKSLVEANAYFYETFARGDADVMETLWAKREDVTCIHPGWGAVTGRDAVIRSWEMVLENQPNIRCGRPEGFLVGDVGYVICLEELGEGRLVATNLFILEDHHWKLIHHQAGVTRPADNKPASGTHPIH